MVYLRDSTFFCVWNWTKKDVFLQNSITVVLTIKYNYLYFVMQRI